MFPGRALAMPSPYSSPESVEDAREVAGRLGIRLDVVPIGAVFDSYRGALAGVLTGRGTGVTEENLQARIRGNYLMAVSNAFGSIVLATGNKSELAVGYSTLYGDLAGGFAPLKDVPKTLVYELARWRNKQTDPPPIPERVLEKPPSAELRPGQLDTDSLPPYEVLDPIVEAYVEDDRSPEDLSSEGADPAVVRRIVEMIDRAEYKRRQAPPGVKITPKAFGRDRRMPITNPSPGRPPPPPPGTPPPPVDPHPPHRSAVLGLRCGQPHVRGLVTPPGVDDTEHDPADERRGQQCQRGAPEPGADRHVVRGYRRGGVGQSPWGVSSAWSEQWAFNPCVGGSNPSRPTSVIRAHARERSGAEVRRRRPAPSCR